MKYLLSFLRCTVLFSLQMIVSSKYFVEKNILYNFFLDSQIRTIGETIFVDHQQSSTVSTRDSSSSHNNITQKPIAKGEGINLFISLLNKVAIVTIEVGDACHLCDSSTKLVYEKDPIER